MDSFRELGRMLLMLGGLLLVVGAFFYFGGKLPFRLGRLPGDCAKTSPAISISKSTVKKYLDGLFISASVTGFFPVP